MENFRRHNENRSNSRGYAQLRGKTVDIQGSQCKVMENLGEIL